MTTIGTPPAGAGLTEPAPASAGVGAVDPLPAGFVWGAATSAYQIEGAVHADGRGASIWDTYSHTPGRVARNDTGDVAADHYHRFAEDVRLMADLGLTAYRFSVSWPRVQPTGSGPVNGPGLAFYDRLVDELLGYGIEPWVTLYHWDLPQVLQEAGGWPNRDTAARFADYAATVAGALADRVSYWGTLNEPWCAAFQGYVSGTHAPGEQDPPRAAAAVHHLLLAHGLAVPALRAAGARDVGVTLNLEPFSPATSSAADSDAARLIDGQLNRLFLDPVLAGRYPPDVVDDLARVGAALPVRDGDLEVIAAPLDWLGVNYYRPHVVRAGRDEGEAGVAPETAQFMAAEDVTIVRQTRDVTAVGWPVRPEAMVELLRDLAGQAPGLPLVIHENGAAYLDEMTADGQVHDPARVDYLARHIDALREAVRGGVDVRGYFVWSLLDNFEWAEGYKMRFGIVHVDFATQRRTPKTSARWYARLIREHTGRGEGS